MPCLNPFCRCEKGKTMDIWVVTTRDASLAPQGRTLGAFMTEGQALLEMEADAKMTRFRAYHVTVLRTGDWGVAIVSDYDAVVDTIIDYKARITTPRNRVS